MFGRLLGQGCFLLFSFSGEVRTLCFQIGLALQSFLLNLPINRFQPGTNVGRFIRQFRSPLVEFPLETKLTTARRNFEEEQRTQEAKLQARKQAVIDRVRSMQTEQEDRLEKERQALAEERDRLSA